MRRLANLIAGCMSAVAGFGCADLLNIEPGRLHPTGMGGAGGAGGLAGTGGQLGGHGGHGGGTCGVPIDANRPLDWTACIDVVLNFEASAQLNLDASSPAAPLPVPKGVPEATTDRKEGMSAIYLPPEQDQLVFEADGAYWNDITTGTLTFGAWVKAQDGSYYVATNYDGANLRGVELQRLSQEDALRCRAGSDGMGAVARSDDAAWSPGVWTHAVCRIGQDGVVAILDGRASDASDAVTSIELAGGALAMLPPNLIGSVDDLFFHQGSLPTWAIRRIWACGIDGQRCQCDSEDGARYDVGASGGCGELQGDDCNDPSLGLPPCNQPAPFE